MSGIGTGHAFRQGQAVEHNLRIIGQGSENGVANLGPGGIKLLDRATCLLRQLQPKARSAAKSWSSEKAVNPGKVGHDMQSNRDWFNFSCTWKLRIWAAS